MKDKKQVIDELNREYHYPDVRFIKGLKRAALMLLMSLIMMLLLVSVVIAKDWVDAHGHAVGLFMLMVGLFTFSYWALWGRKQ